MEVAKKLRQCLACLGGPAPRRTCSSCELYDIIEEAAEILEKSKEEEVNYEA